MQLIKNNPFRIIGLLAGATAKEQDRQIRRLKQYLAAEQEPEDDYSFPTLGTLDRTLEDVTEASSKLTLDNDKITAALFWFWNGSSITDEPAFDALKEGDVDTAFKIWEDLIIVTNEDGKRGWKKMSERNYSALHNFFIISMFHKNGNINNAVIANIQFIESEFFTKFSTSVVGDNFKPIKKDLQIMFLNQLMQQADVETEKLIKIVNKCSFKAKDESIFFIIKRITEPIDNKIELARSKRKTNKFEAANAGQELYTTILISLNELKTIVGENDIKYTTIADKVANEILQCSIDFFNENKEIDSKVDYFEISVQLAKQAKTIAIGNLTKGRVNDSLKTLEELKDKELLQAIDVLKSIKTAHEEACKKIDKQVDDLQYDTFDFAGQKMKLPKPNVSINWSKVAEMKKDALNWDKVIELIQEVIPIQNIDKIKNSKNTLKLEEYKALVQFLMNKLSYSFKNRINYINYWEAPKTTNSKPTSSGGCYIATMAYGSYEHPQVLVLRQFRDEVLDKSAFGKWFIRTYYHYSPMLVEKLKEHKKTNLVIRKLLNQFIKLIKS